MDMCVDMCKHRCVHMCEDLQLGACVGMGADMCTEWSGRGHDVHAVTVIVTVQQ